MAGPSDSRVFVPPMNRITDNDPQIVRVPMDRTDWGFRSSQRPASENKMDVANIQNGK